MSLTVFLAICILGCDVLIYFLYEWAFGESKRIRKRMAASRLRADATLGTQGQQSRMPRKPLAGALVIEMDRKRGKPVVGSAQANAHEEKLAYRRLAASFGQLRPRT